MDKSFHQITALDGIQVQVCDYAPKTKWELPKHQFFEWEPKDEPFCRKYGIGKEVPCFMIVEVPKFSYQGPATVLTGRKEKRVLIHPDSHNFFMDGIKKENELDPANASCPASRRVHRAFNGLR